MLLFIVFTRVIILYKYKKRAFLLLAGVAVLCLTSCRSAKLQPYLIDAQRDTAQAVLNTYSSTILPGDILHIYVSSQSPEAVVAFNQETNQTIMSSNTGVGTSSNTLNNIGFLVGNDGRITYPVLGELIVKDITRDSLASYLEGRLKSGGYVNDPVVTVELMNFRVTVLGEVRDPKQMHLDGNRLTILEALALSGDITDDGKRNNVAVLREQDGEFVKGELDLTGKDFFDSPYYYLRQNDIVYVEANDRKKRSSYQNTEWPQYITLGVSVATLYMTLLRIERFR